MSYSFLADLVVALHVAYVGFVIVGELAILLGWLCRWGWVRDPWFRLGHLAAIALVALEAIFNIPCPLTIWEDRLRAWSGQDVAGGTFIGRALHNLLFYEAPAWVFTLVYIGFGLLVLATLFLVTPRWRSSQRVGAGPLSAGGRDARPSLKENLPCPRAH
jgi:Protein of Unknown function (DUF2784)